MTIKLSLYNKSHFFPFKIERPTINRNKVEKVIFRLSLNLFHIKNLSCQQVTLFSFETEQPILLRNKVKTLVLICFWISVTLKLFFFPFTKFRQKDVPVWSVSLHLTNFVMNSICPLCIRNDWLLDKVRILQCFVNLDNCERPLCV